MTAAVLVGLLVVTIGAWHRPRPERCRAVAHFATTRSEPSRRIAPRRRPRRRSAERRATDIADWCDALARAVRAGATLGGAIRDVEPPVGARDQISGLRLALDRGAPLRQALSEVVADVELAVALTVLRAVDDGGGAAAEPLDRAASALRGRAAEAADRRTQSEQARLSAVVMTVLPIAMLCVLATTSATIRQILTSPLGVVLLVAGGGLNLAGWRWMRRLIAGAAR